MKIILILFSLLILFVVISRKNLFLPKKESILSAVATITSHPTIAPTTEPTATPLPTPTVIKPTPTINTPTPVKKPTVIILPTPTPDYSDWGKTKQLDEVTYSQKLPPDAKNGTPQEIFDAINNFRQTYSKQPLSWDENLAKWAESRAKNYVDMKGTDKHEGFIKDAQTKGVEYKYGLFAENGAYGPRLEAVHWIEWVFASDEGHKGNLLCDKCTTVGVGIFSNDNLIYGIDMIFGGEKF